MALDLNPLTGNIFGATTNSGKLGSGLSGINGFGSNLPEKLSSLTGVSDTIADVTKTYGSKYTSKDKSLSESDQRLHIVRPRSARSLYTEGSKGNYTSDRGPIAYMRLLAPADYNAKNEVAGTTSNVDVEVQELLSKSTKGGFTKFFLTDVSVSYTEKSQVMTTFGDNEVVYYFGKQPVMFNLSGMLFDSMENDWFSKFLTLYQRVLRGTMLAKNFCLIELVLPNLRLVGTISALTHQQSSARDTDIGFGMQFIAKEVEPLPVEVPSGTIANLSGSLIDFKADRQGVGSWVYSLSTGSSGGFITKLGNSVQSALSIGDKFSNTLNSFRTSIFSPIFGVISSITKIVKSVTGSITKIISSFTNPINQILRDITSIASKASSLALLVENSIHDIVSIPGRTIASYNTTIRALKRSAGIISRTPENIADIFRRQFSSGRLHAGLPILSSGKKRKKSKVPILGSGVKYVHTQSYKL